ncbi:MAG TPA: FkbM family methyltransferase [Polyangia bacterium]|jgi:FkbM family methyltransferase
MVGQLRITEATCSVRTVLPAAEPWLGRLWSARNRAHLWLFERTRLLPHLNLTSQVSVGGRVFKIPVKQGIRLYAIDVEPWLDGVIRRLTAARAGSFVDVGANLGQTLLKVKAVVQQARYFGFEPNPRCYCYLSDVIALNALPACKIYPFALGQAPAVVELFQSSAADPSASIVEGFRPDEHYSSRQFATVFPGDQVLGGAEIDAISVIKIDVEGAERDVLLGLAGTIDRHRPSIICEVLPVYDEHTGNGAFRLARQREIESFLRQRNYTIQRVGADGQLIRIQEIGIHDDLGLCNYVFAPVERPA